MQQHKTSRNTVRLFNSNRPRYIDITPYGRLIHTHANDVLVFVNSAAVPGRPYALISGACGNNTVWHLKICRHAAATTSHTSSTLDKEKATRKQQQRSIIRSHFLSPNSLRRQIGIHTLFIWQTVRVYRLNIPIFYDWCDYTIPYEWVRLTFTVMIESAAYIFTSFILCYTCPMPHVCGRWLVSTCTFENRKYFGISVLQVLFKSPNDMVKILLEFASTEMMSLVCWENCVQNR